VDPPVLPPGGATLTLTLIGARRYGCWGPQEPPSPGLYNPCTACDEALLPGDDQASNSRAASSAIAAVPLQVYLKDSETAQTARPLTVARR
jgi:hypothetical protein